MKNEGARVVTTLYSYILDAQVQLTLQFGGLVCWILLLIQALMGVLYTFKTEEDPFKNERARVVIKRYPIVFLCRFFMMLKGK